MLVELFARVPLHVPRTNTGTVTVPILCLAGCGAVLLLIAALAAFARRRSRSYLLIAATLAALVSRTGVGVLFLFGRFSMETHHLIEHALDVAIATCLIAAVVFARTAAPNGRPDSERARIGTSNTGPNDARTPAESENRYD